MYCCWATLSYTNEFTERNVRTLKNCLRPAGDDRTPTEEIFQTILLNYSIIYLFHYHCTCGKSPVDLHLIRKLCIYLDSIFPKRAVYPANQQTYTSFQVVERIQTLLFIHNKPVLKKVIMYFFNYVI